jgi:hypothetical protein
MIRHVAPYLLLLCVAAAQVKPAQIVETREQTLIKKEGFFSSERSRLVVKLSVSGPDVRGATKWGKVKLTEAVDDAGTDLKPKENTFAFSRGEDMDEINRFGQDEKAEGFDVELELAVPARKATTIKSLKGEFHVLAGGEEKVVTFTKLKSMQGKPLTDPALKAAGIDATVGKSSGNDPALVVDYKGAADAITKVEILDAGGDSMSSGQFSSGSGDAQNVNYMLGKPLDDAMTLKLHLVVGQKTVAVPFELKDLKLP